MSNELFGLIQIFMLLVNIVLITITNITYDFVCIAWKIFHRFNVIFGKSQFLLVLVQTVLLKKIDNSKILFLRKKLLSLVGFEPGTSDLLCYRHRFES